MTKPLHAIANIALLAALCGCSSGSAGAPERVQAPEPDAGIESRSLSSLLQPRLTGDRTGACLAAAVVGREVQRGFLCANAQSARSIDAKTVFEVGSISKTMTALLLADLLEQGSLDLDDALSMHVPQGTAVPEYDGQPIRLRHLVSHTAGLPGLPSRMRIDDPENPYAALTQAALLDSLGDVQLTAAPGTSFAYSNFGFMLLSYVVSHESGENFEALLEARLFEPLGMQQAFVAKKPEGVVVAQGHLSTGSEAPLWDFPVDLAGVGGVRASLDDMVHYVEAALGRGDAHTVALLERTLTPLASQHGQPQLGLAWFLIPVQGRTVAMHDGGTGGFSSLVLVDREADRGVVLLLDTSFANLGGVVEIGLHLLDPDSFAMPLPRLTEKPRAELLQALAGRYRLGDLTVTLRQDNGVLFALPSGQPELELAFDSYGDFFPSTFDALLTPVRAADGRQTFRWTQGGGAIEAERLP
jgi:D-alanyl-D-alanine-carboxypeptidase/D-alanyl-D-alanine-endopeptidase